jgi:ankyrin repeat protein
VIALALSLAVLAQTPSTSELLLAVTKGDAAEIARLVDAGADPNARDEEGNPALLLGVDRGTDVVRALLSRGAEVDATNDDGETPLIRAAQGNVEIVRLLLDAGADVSHRDALGLSALTVAKEAGADVVVGLLRDRGAKESLEDQLDAAVRADDRDAVDRLIAAGVDVDALDTSSYQTPLMTAVALGRLEILTKLLDAGADPGVEGTGIETTGENAVRMAARMGSPWALRQLLSARPQRGLAEDALLLGCANESVVRVALEQGARPDAKDSRGQSALACAAAAGAAGAVSILLEAGADPNAPSQGRTALGWAIRNGHGDVVRLLKSASSRP